MKNLIILFALFALTLVAADITGTWKATAEGPNGAIERTFIFKQDGSKLTGKSISSRFGESNIQDGKVDGDNISFSITMNFNGNELNVKYSGKVQGDTMKLTSEAGDNRFEWTAKRGS
jgi:hypothetical protein